MQPSVVTIIHVGPENQQSMTRDMVCRTGHRPRSLGEIIKDDCPEPREMAYHRIILIT